MKKVKGTLATLFVLALVGVVMLLFTAFFERPLNAADQNSMAAAAQAADDTDNNEDNDNDTDNADEDNDNDDDDNTDDDADNDDEDEDSDNDDDSDKEDDDNDEDTDNDDDNIDDDDEDEDEDEDDVKVSNPNPNPISVPICTSTMLDVEKVIAILEKMVFSYEDLSYEDVHLLQEYFLNTPANLESFEDFDILHGWQIETWDKTIYVLLNSRKSAAFIITEEETFKIVWPIFIQLLHY